MCDVCMCMLVHARMCALGIIPQEPSDLILRQGFSLGPGN